MKYFVIFSVILILVGCNNILHKQTNNPIEKSYVLYQNNSKASKLKVDEELMNKLKEVLKNDTVEIEQKTIKGIINLMKKFNEKKLDTTVLVIGNINGDNVLDTIYSRVYLLDTNVYVKSNWVSGKDTLWSYQLKNPHFYLDNQALFEYENRSLWIKFGIGVLYAPPDIVPLKLFDLRNDTNISKIIIDEGMAYLKKKGFKLSVDDYKLYLNNFKGNLLSFDDPEFREGCWIWYKPKKTFIEFYFP